MQKKLYKSYLFTYRLFAFIMLYGLLVVIGGYGIVMGFYSINTSWVVPMSISPTNDKILQMTQQIVTTQSTINTIRTNSDTLSKTRTELMARKAALQSLDYQLSAAILKERGGNSATGTTLNALLVQKQQDISDTSNLLAQMEQTKLGIDHDLKAGLITQADATQQISQLTQFKNSFTDSKVSQAMTDLTRQHLSDNNLAAVDMATKQIELRTQIAAIELSISTGDVQIANNNQQIATIQKAYDTVQSNPYYLATLSKTPLPFAFVPYDNQKRVEVGAAVYDCYLSMVACRQVGTISKVFQDEEKATNPFYKTDIRGFLVQLNLTNFESTKSKTLFIGRKPILF